MDGARQEVWRRVHGAASAQLHRQIAARVSVAPEQRVQDLQALLDGLRVSLTDTEQRLAAERAAASRCATTCVLAHAIGPRR
jgi:uncharacterized membrane protein